MAELSLSFFDNSKRKAKREDCCHISKREEMEWNSKVSGKVKNAVQAYFGENLRLTVSNVLKITE